MSSWEDYIAFLPEMFRKKNNKKLLELFLPSVLEMNTILQEIAAVRVLDNALGHHLDMLGSVYNVPRDGMTDERYREAIRTRLLSYASSGELHVIADVSKTIFGERFQSVEEAWHNPAYGNRPATVIVNLEHSKDGLPVTNIDAVKQVKAGGVAVDVASLNTWGNIFEYNATWGEVYEKYKNWGEAYGYMSQNRSELNG